MGKYRKKPVVVEAIQWTGDNIEEVRKFMDPQKPTYIHGFSNSDELIGVDTLEGGVVATKGDYIIKGIKGEFYPCKPDIFAATYTWVPQAHTGEGYVLNQEPFAWMRSWLDAYAKEHDGFDAGKVMDWIFQQPMGC